MKPKKHRRGIQTLRLVASGTKIWNQLMMFIVVGILPLLFPQWIYIKDQKIVFIIVGLALITSAIYEVWRSYLEKQGKDSTLIINIQLLTSVLLLTGFLHFFGRINGPFFVLYLLTIMESYLNRNIFLASIVVGTMIFTTTTEFAWLIFQKEIVLGFIPGVGFMVRIISLIFMSTYGSVLGQKIMSEEKARSRAQTAADRLKETTESLKRTNVKLKQISALKGEFVSLTSHELRTPLIAIAGSLSTILEGFAGKINARVKEFLEGAYNENSRLLRLVNNLLNISRIEAGRLKFDIAPLDLKEAISRTFESLAIQAKERKLDLVFESEAKLLVRADKDKVREVLVNLVGNAIKFTNQGRVAVYAGKQGKLALVGVEDTGRGILPQDQPKLFKKFERVDGVESSEKKGGTGLGLYICKNLIEGMEGEIWLQSEHGKGSTFFFTLPLA